MFFIRQKTLWVYENDLFMLWFFEEESQVHAENVEAKQQLL